MTAKITLSTIESNAYDNVVAYLNDRSIVTDPRDKGGFSKRTFVYDTDPLMKSVNFGDFPYIIAEHPTVEYSNTSANGKVKEVSWTMNLTVRTARDGAGQGITGKGKQDLFTISDSLQSLFNNNTYKAEFQALNMYFMNLTKIDSSAPIIDNKYLYEASYELSFMTRMEVSA